jgi:hypothetical protein
MFFVDRWFFEALGTSRFIGLLIRRRTRAAPGEDACLAVAGVAGWTLDAVVKSCGAGVDVVICRCSTTP